MPIPELDPTTNALPSGLHSATLDEIVQVYGSSYGRKVLCATLRWIVGELWSLGVKEIWIGGSFVSGKLRPNDIDMIFVPPPGQSMDGWGPLAWRNHDELKRTRKVHLFPHPSMQPAKGNPFAKVPLVEWFGTDRSGRQVGLISVERPAHVEERPPVEGSPEEA